MRQALSTAIFGIAFALGPGPLHAGWVEPDGTVVLKIEQSRPIDAAADPRSIANRAVMNAFRQYYQKKHRRPIRIISHQQLKIEGAYLDSPTLLAIAGGTAPDVLGCFFRRSDTYIRQGFLYPLDEFIAKLTPEEQAELDPAAFARLPEAVRQRRYLRVTRPTYPVVRREGPDGKPRTWFLPYSRSVSVLMYRKDTLASYGVAPGKWVYKPKPKFGSRTFKEIFAEAGLRPDRWVDGNGKPLDWGASRACRTWGEIEPRNWKELFELCCQIHDPDNGVKAFQLSKGPVASFVLFKFLYGAGSRALEQDAQGRWRCAFDDDGAADAVLFYRLLCKFRYVDAGGKPREGVAWRGSGTYWSEGKVGLLYQSLNDELLAELNPDIVGVGGNPRGPSGVFATMFNAGGFGIFSKIEDPIVREAAFEYAWFFGSLEAARIRTEVYVRQGFAKFVHPDLLRRFGFSEYLPEISHGLQQVYDSALEHGIPEPYGRNCQFVYHEITKPLDKVLYYPDKRWDALSPEQKRIVTLDALAIGVRDTEEKIIGRVEPDVRRFRNFVALIVAIVMLVIFVLMFIYISRTFTVRAGGMARGGVAGKSRRWAYLIMVPALGTILLWQYVPLVRGITIAFMDYRIVGQSEWVWLGNFADALFDPGFWRALMRSVYYVMLTLTLTFLPPILLAILLQEVPKGKVLFRVIYYLPAVTTGLIIMFLWRGMYEPGENGMLNRVMMSVNLWPAWAAAASKWGLLALASLVLWVLLRIPMQMQEQEMPRRAVWAVPLFTATLVAAYFALGVVVEGQSIVAVPCKALMASLLVAGLWHGVRKVLHLPDDYLPGRVFWTLPFVVMAGATVWLVASAVGEAGPAGTLDAVKDWLGSAWAVKPSQWLNDPDLALFCCVLPQMWAGMGPGCLIYLAALKSIPDDLYEAADLDGAGFLGKIRHVVFPILKPLIIIQFIAAFIHAFRAVQFIFAVSGRGPSGSTNVLGLEIFYNSFVFLKFGLAAAMAWMLGAFLIGFTVFQLRILTRLQFTTSESQKLKT